MYAYLPLPSPPPKKNTPHQQQQRGGGLCIIIPQNVDNVCFRQNYPYFEQFHHQNHIFVTLYTQYLTVFQRKKCKMHLHLHMLIAHPEQTSERRTFGLLHLHSPPPVLAPGYVLDTFMALSAQWS